MKVSKIFSAVVIASAMLATVADASSIGRSGGSSSGDGGRKFASSFSIPADTDSLKMYKVEVV